MSPFIVSSAWTWHYVAGRYRGEWPGRVTGIVGGLTSCWTFVATCWSQRWSFVGAEPTSRQGEEREGTKCLLRSHDEIPDTLQPFLTPKWCPLRHAIPAGDAEIVFEGGAHKRTYAGTFTTAAERIALTRKNRLSLTKRNIGKPLVNNFAFNTVIYGITYAIYKTNGLTN